MEEQVNILNAKIKSIYIDSSKNKIEVKTLYLAVYMETQNFYTYLQKNLRISLFMVLRKN